MAQRIQVAVIDDLDGTSPADRTVSFGWQGTSYEIDLSEQHASELEAALAPFIQSARKMARTRRRASAPAVRHDQSAIREWARANGHQISARGRISASIIAAYDAVH